MERKKSFVPSMAEGIRRVKEGNYAFIGEAVSLDLVVARYCELTRAPETVSMRSYSIAAPLGEELTPVARSKLVRASCTGHKVTRQGQRLYKVMDCIVWVSYSRSLHKQLESHERD